MSDVAAGRGGTTITVAAGETILGAFDLPGSNVTLVVEGRVESDAGRAVVSGIGTENTAVVVAAGGVVRGGFIGIDLAGFGPSAGNGGRIEAGADGIGIAVTAGLGASIGNTGTIAAGTGVLIAGGSGARVVNEGTIAATHTGIVGSTADGVFVLGNFGRIEAGGVGVLLRGGERAANVLHNAGAIVSGETLAVLAGDARDTVSNGGLFVGDVVLGGGSDHYVATGEGRVVGVVRGGAGADSLVGGAATDILAGDDGRDTLEGGAGDDRLYGGAGDDRIEGGDGADAVDAGAGDDSASGGDRADVLAGGLGADILLGGAGNDALFGGDGGDDLHGGDCGDMLDGGAGGDRLHGEAGADRLFGGDARDALSGGDGNDRLFGGDGRDVLSGGDGADLLVGGPGVDVLTGGAGGDVFLVCPGDGGATVTDFAAGDRIDLAGYGIDAAALADRMHMESDAVLLVLPGGDWLRLAGAVPGDLDGAFLI